jgi:hypothetical protein
MKQFGLALVVVSALSLAQTPAQKPQLQGQRAPADAQRVAHTEIPVSNMPTLDDMYCSGFITTQRVPETHYVVGGQGSPEQVHYAGATDRIFLWGGSDLKPGDRLQIVRHVKNPNRYESYRGERAAIKETGEPYFERGYVRVVEVQKNVAIAIPELSCADILPGDLAVPFVERDKPAFRKLALDRFTPPNGKATGRIIMANEFDTSVGTTQKVYLNIGEDKGLKVGDYLRVTRRYDYAYHEPESSMSTQATEMEDTMNRPPRFPKGDEKELPRLTLGAVMILHVHPKSATAIVTTALEDIRVGDGVELLDLENTTMSAEPRSGQQQYESGDRA